MSEQKQEARCATTQNNNDPNTQKQQQQTAVKKKDSATRWLEFRRKRIPQNRELFIPCCKIFH